MEVAERHFRNKCVQARDLFRPVEAIVTVPFVDHVVKFGVQPAGEFRVAAEFIHHDVIVPRPIDIARAAFVAPDVSTLAVEHRLVRLRAAPDEVPG